jgi:LAO/AO transport system kinase
VPNGKIDGFGREGRALEDLMAKFSAGEQRALARVISLVENESPEKDELLRRLYPRTGAAYIVGITGAPGSGKSSLVDRLTGLIRRAERTVGIVAVDPTSPFTGGALLGDRIRMQEHACDGGVFIRSMGTRGSLGGLARTTKDVIKVLDAFGFDYILVETVGVGQAELDIMHVADTTVVVLTPATGDSIQTIKAGIMEIADVFAVNKADLPGARKLAVEVEAMLDLQGTRPAWRPPVVLTSTVSGEGLEELWAAVERHRAHLVEAGLFERRRQERARAEALEIADHRWQAMVRQHTELPGPVNELLARVEARELDPYTAAAEILQWVISASPLRGAGCGTG